MKLFRDTNVPSVLWKYRAEGAIWRVFPTRAGILFGEVRDIQKKKAGFFSVDRHSGKLYWKGEQVHEWWTGVEGIFGEMMILHGFATPDMPIHRGVHAVDGRTGSTVWKQDDMACESITSNGVLASQGAPGNKTFFLLNGDDGLVVKEWHEREHSPYEMTGIPAEEIASYPDTVPEPAGHVAAFLAGEGTSGPCSILESVVTVIAYRKEDASGQWIALLSGGSSKPVYADRIIPGAGPFVPDSFLMQEGYLYYVKDRSQLIALTLPEAR